MRLKPLLSCAELCCAARELQRQVGRPDADRAALHGQLSAVARDAAIFLDTYPGSGHRHRVRQAARLAEHLQDALGRNDVFRAEA